MATGRGEYWISEILSDFAVASSANISSFQPVGTVGDRCQKDQKGRDTKCFDINSSCIEVVRQLT